MIGTPVPGPPPTPPTPPTLTSALSALEELTKRLTLISSRAYDLALMVGGPFPTRGEKANGGEPSPQSAMCRLNGLVGDAHGLLSDIDGAISAMARSLGAST
jgi:hypothetical protein